MDLEKKFVIIGWHCKHHKISKCTPIMEKHIPECSFHFKGIGITNLWESKSFNGSGNKIRVNWSAQVTSKQINLVHRRKIHQSVLRFYKFWDDKFVAIYIVQTQ